MSAKDRLDKAWQEQLQPGQPDQAKASARSLKTVLTGEPQHAISHQIFPVGQCRTHLSVWLWPQGQPTA
ncbi:hypothetical protein [Alkanindiges hydrocarboniclasticus]|uniref:hypothetical protein n=1 Tax=Alkanindiges hydrocarboniclasticus TaxID=1907941 RepID=UPI001301767F|nr:hypothetical protein [Alkanindiges hydrocarboniclasticus]